ncbi:YbaN family protein [Colwelliaceae bacterium BS250]
MKRIGFLFLGFSFVALATVGAFLPVLPTTPFLLLAAGCFAKSSTRCLHWLTTNKLFDPIISAWHHQRCIPVKAKIMAILSIVLFGGYSLFFVISNIYVQLLMATLLIIGLLVVARIKNCETI